MSCHSHPGNRATLTIARFVAGAATGTPASAQEAQRTFHSLLAEGRSLKVETPDSSEVERWFDESEYQAASVIPKGRSRSATLANLGEAWQRYRDSGEAGLAGEAFHAWKHTPSLLAYQEAREEHPDPRRIAVDLDGCLYDFTTTMREWLIARGWQREDLPDPQTYSLTQSWQMSSELLRVEMSRALAAGVLFRRGEAFDDGIEHARRIGLKGHRLVAVTARQFPGLELEARRATIQWMRDNHIHPDETHLVGLQGGAEKNKIHYDLLIDDSPENIHAAHAAGRKAVLLDREWNRDEAAMARLDYSDISSRIESLAD